MIIVILIAIIFLTLNITLGYNRQSVGVIHWIAPMSLILLGALVTFTPWGLEVNATIKNMFMRDNFAQKRFDDYAQFIPLALAFVFNICGIKGKHNYRDLAIISVIAILVMFVGVHAIKNLTGILRPDGSASNSFPSGHTAMAFVGAEILYQEYKHRAPWYGVIGYAASLGVGTMRMYNNRHWVGDVLSGSGVGIISSKIAYFIFQKIKERRDTNKK